MSIYTFLDLQELEPQEDGTVSTLDEYEHDETIDLTQEVDGEELVDIWTHLEQDMHKKK